MTHYLLELLGKIDYGRLEVVFQYLNNCLHRLLFHTLEEVRKFLEMFFEFEILHRLHTVSFDWFLSGLEWILNLESFLRNDYGISDLGFSTFWFFVYLIKIVFYWAKNFNFDQTYLNTGSKTQNVEKLGLDLIFHNHSW